MVLTGLENNYYLSNNDINVTVSATSLPSIYIDVSFKNETTGVEIGPLRPYPNLVNEYVFNVCMPIRSLMPEPDHVNVNTLHFITIRITAMLNDGTTENYTISKYFIRGGLNKQSTTEWYLTNAQPLKVGIWPVWRGITLPTGAYRIQGSAVVEYTPTDTEEVISPNLCDCKIVRFLNRLGGYQYWIFESYTEIDETKGGKSKLLPARRLRQNVSRQLSVTTERQIVLKSSVPIKFAELIKDLQRSNDLYIYDPNGDDWDSHWQRVEIAGTNKLEINNVTGVVNSEITFNLPEYVNRLL